jgi:hypothetical protein
MLRCGNAQNGLPARKFRGFAAPFGSKRMSGYSIGAYKPLSIRGGYNIGAFGPSRPCPKGLHGRVVLRSNLNNRA